MTYFKVGLAVIASAFSLSNFGQDATPPQLVSAGSLDGTVIGVCFDEALDPSVASDVAHYALNGGATVNSATLQADGLTVALEVSGLAGNSFTVTVTGVKDVAGNEGGGTASGQVLGFTPQDLGDVAAPGFAVSCGPGSVDVTARGNDIWGFADSGHFVSEERTGDFDVRVRVQRFDAPSLDANAGLMVRESSDAASRLVGIVVYPGQKNWTATQRAESGGASSVLPGNWRIVWPTGVDYPNVWVRMKRAGNTFTMFGGTNGVDWVQIGDSVTPEVPYPDTVLVGMRTTPVEVEVAGSTAFAQYRDYGNFAITGAQIEILQQPANASISENTSATFSVNAHVTGTSTNNISYQWQRDGVNIPGATLATYTTAPLTLADTGAKFRVLLSLPGGSVLQSQEAMLTVTPDTTAPKIVSTASLDGLTIGVCFDETMDSATANDLAHYTISGVDVFSATLQSDGKTVALGVSQLPGNTFTLNVTGVTDLAGNAITATATGSVLGFTAQDLGAVEAPGVALSCAPGAVDVWARGLDIWGFADSGNFVSENRTGDFDVRVQVPHFESLALDANAGLMARESSDAGSRNVSVVVYANQRNWTATQRAEVDGASSVLSGNWRIDWPAGAGYTNIWLRLKRAGNTFTTYGGTNGQDWIQIGDSVTPEVPYADALLVGLRTTPVEVEQPGTTAFAQYRNYGDFAITNASITISQQPASVTAIQNGTATFSVFASAPGVSSENLGYQWQNDGVDIPNATSANYTTPLLQTSDSGSKYRVRVSLPGGASVLSEEATLTVSADLNAPQIVSAASLGGRSVGICFNESLDPESANDSTHYTLGGGTTINSATLQADGKTVVLDVTGATGATLNLSAAAVKDLAGNSADLTFSVPVLPLTAEDLGDVPEPGFAFSCMPGSVDVAARGSDIWGVADSGQFVSEERTGDFDVRVQVQSMQAPAPDSNAGLMARESLDAGSRNVQIVVYANQRNWTAAQRVETDGASSVLPGNWRIDWPPEAGYSNIWVRLKRAGNTFTTYGGTNGVDWIQIGDSVTPATPYPDTILVGLRTTPTEVEQPGTTAFAQYRNYGDFTVSVTPQLSIATSGANEITLTWPAAGSDAFVLESATAIGSGTWTPVTGAPATQGGTKTITLPRTGSGSQFFRLRRP